MTRSTQHQQTQTAEIDRLYSYAEIAELARVSERQVRRWVEEQRLSYVQLPRGRRVTGQQYLDFINSRIVIQGEA
jgi:excisionase family DNA binding protein